MQEPRAVSIADEYIKLIIQHQEGFVHPSTLSDEQRARQKAQMLAAFRQELIAQLMQQP